MREFRPRTWRDIDALVPRWKREEPVHVCDAIIFDVERLSSVSPTTGKRFDFTRLRASDWVNVVALTPEGKLVMVVQQRHGIDRATLEIPAGLVDNGEAPADAALRELEEETGLVPSSLIHIGTVFPNPAFFDNLCHTYLAEECKPAGTIRRDAAEELEVVLVDPAEAPRLMAEGLLGNAMGIVGLHWYALRLQGHVWQGEGNMRGNEPLASSPAQQ